MKKLIIEQLKEGFVFSDENNEKYAVSSGALSKRVSAYFGLTRHASHKERGTKNNIAPPAETQGSKTADSHSAGATSWSPSTEQAQKHPAGSNAIGKKLGTPDTVLHPSDLKLPAFEYEKDKMQQYKSLQFLELNGGRVVLDYAHSHYYTSKDVVMQIPYPFPNGYFSKENGWSSSVEMAFKLYRRYLFEQEQGRQVEFPTCVGMNRQEDPDDWKYKKILNTNTRTDYDNNKIEGSLEV